MSDAGTKPTVAGNGAGELPFRFETRLAVVLYGGVSLCIYINGVAQELLHLVRASAPSDPGDPASPMFPDVTGVEKVYREVACRLGSRAPLAPDPDPVVRTRVVVDVLSGTSAGGLNGLFLAKALANGRDMETLKKLWIEQGDMALLLNDGASLKGLPRSARKKVTESLLNSQRMYLELYRALQAMKPREGRDPEEPVLADELDLFVTATDLTGLPLPLRIANGLVYERRHKNVFHFVGATKRATGAAENDFKSANDAFLAYAGRCTSSFPLAFEPMRFEDVAQLRDGLEGPGRDGLVKDWDSFYRDYLRRPEGGPPDPDPTSERGDFAGRSFGDGGYLDNKPFSHAIDALQGRHADATVRRKLIYVEPSPEHPEQDRGVRPKPNAFENLLAAGSTLPRQETIREDLERVLERNERIEHVLRATRFVPDDVRSAARAADGGADQGRTAPHPSLPSDQYQSLWLGDMVRRYGPAYGSYHRIKVAELTSELAGGVTRVLGLDEDSDDALAIRTLMSAWRQQHYETDAPDDRTRKTRELRGLPARDWRSENRLLLDFDLSYRLRRLFFIRDIIQGLGGLETIGPRPGGAPPDSPRYSLDRAMEIMLSAGFAERDVQACRDHLAAFDGELRGILRELARIHVDLRVAGRELRSRTESPLAGTLAELKLRDEELHSVLRPTRARDRVKVARVVLGYDSPPRAQGQPGAGPEEAALAALRLQRPAILSRATAIADERLKKAFTGATKRLEGVVPPEEKLGARPAGDTDEAAHWIARKCVRFYYDRFEHYDMVLFPMIYGADVGELAEVQVLRVSPEDACGLVRERDADTGQLLIHKLAGTHVANFGAFLDATWRLSDILWGRLDAAEILIKQLLDAPATPEQQATRDGIVYRAQIAILEEDLLPLDTRLGRRVLVEAFLHTPGGEPDPRPLTAMLDRLAPYLQTGSRIAALLDHEAVTGAFLDAFARERELPALTRYRLMSRAAAVFGHILDGLEGTPGGVTKPLARALTSIGRSAWGLVELAVPRSLPSLIFGRGVFLIYALELTLLAGGYVLGSDPARAVGGQLLLLTVGLHVLWGVLGMRLRGFRDAWKLLLLLVALVVLALAGIGGVMFGDFWARMVGRFVGR